MHRRTNPRVVSRRRALVRLAAGAAGAAGVSALRPRLLAAMDAPPGPSRPSGPPRPSVIGTSPAGAEIWQVTTEERRHSNIYCEVPYCSRSSRRFVYEREIRESGQSPGAHAGAGDGPNRTELVAVELGTWKEDRLDVTTGLGGSAISHDGILYYLKRSGDRDLDLMRADIDDGRPERVYRRKMEPWVRSLGTISADGRRYAGGVRLADDWSLFGIVVVDLEKGTEEVVDRDPFILNPHPQFDPGDPERLMIQHNRGGRFSPDGKLERLVGPEGATLYFLSVPDGKRTELRVGKPHTTPCTGHEAWIARTGTALLTVSASGEFAPERGNLLGLRAGEPAKVVSKGYAFNHVGVSRCGRYFSCDDWRPPYRLIVGSIATGRSAVLCDAETSPTGSQSTHPHAYLTPDRRWLIFNSNRKGHPHIHAASVPEGLLEGLEKA